uniref:Uncharacterized protein n=1 Tax=Arundo donax TaxID=35708 RepID=A0A0A9BKT8_ARUDO
MILFPDKLRYRRCLSIPISGGKYVMFVHVRPRTLILFAMEKM